MRTSEPSTVRRSRGFSLIELLVVTAIIAIAAAMVAPNIAGYLRLYRIRGASQQVISQIQTGRAKGINRNVNLGVTFVAQQRQSAWVIEDDLLPNNTPDWWQYASVDLTTLLANRDQSSGWVPLPESIEFDAPTACPGGAAATAWGLRFSRLGSQCPIGAANCPTPGSSTYPLLIATDATGNALLCLVDRRSGVRRRIMVSPGGRIVTQ